MNKNLKKNNSFYYQNQNNQTSRENFEKQEKSLLENFTMISFNVNTNNSNNNLTDLTNVVHNKKMPSDSNKIESISSLKEELILI